MTVDDYIANLKSPQREIAEELRRLVKEAAPGVTESIKWRMPVFEQDGLVCYIDSTKEHVRFGFYRGAELPDPDGILEGTSKVGRHIRMRDLSDIRKSSLINLVTAAVRLNRSRSQRQKG
ncbi:MAG: DUF1801 domain-containing protein [Dehalococcoidia bacterium]